MYGALTTAKNTAPVKQSMGASAPRGCKRVQKRSQLRKLLPRACTTCSLPWSLQWLPTRILVAPNLSPNVCEATHSHRTTEQRPSRRPRRSIAREQFQHVLITWHDCAPVAPESVGILMSSRFGFHFTMTVCWYTSSNRMGKKYYPNHECYTHFQW